MYKKQGRRYGFTPYAGVAIGRKTKNFRPDCVFYISQMLFVPFCMINDFEKIMSELDGAKHIT